MRQILIFIFTALIVSCSTNKNESNKADEEQLAEQSAKSSSIIKETSIPEQIQKREFLKESITTLANTIWINSPFPNCTDTLKILSNGGQYYSCEHDLNYEIQLEVKSDTLYIYKYGLISEVNADLGIEVKTKYRLIKSNGLLIMVGIAHRYQDRFEPVGTEFLFQEFNKIE